MRRILLSLTALSMALPMTVAFPIDGVSAQNRHHYRGRSYRHYRGRCRHSSGTTGLVAGGVGGAFAGRAIDRTITANKRCR